MGSYSRACNHCDSLFFGGYNSCRNRNCPSCGGPTRARWLARVRQDILPVDYFHVVFTLPESLSKLALANREIVYGLLFRASWQSLSQLAADPGHLGGQIGALAVLHTWNQQLLHHAHVHYVIPGGALSSAGTWVPARRSKKSGKGYFLCVEALSRLFRGKFLAGLKRLHASGKLRLPPALARLADRRAWEQFLTPLHRQEWVVHGEGPPKGQPGPDAVLKYLARYVAGVAISDRRLISHDGQTVQFWVREPKKPGRSSHKTRRRPSALPGAEFVRRFLLHILPRGFRRVRYYGLLSNRHRQDQVARVRALLGAGGTATEETRAPVSHRNAGTGESLAKCPRCGVGLLEIVPSEETPRGWVEVLLSSAFATESDWSWWRGRLRRNRCRGDPSGRGNQKVAP